MLTFGAAAENEIEDVARFLRAIFGAAPDHAPFRTGVLRWKGFAPHPLWSGSRSYVYRDGETIRAHGCVTPIEWMHAGGVTRTACVVDWAADRSAPGLGMLLYRGVAQMLDGVTGIGGSDDARRVLPRAGFRQIAEMPVFTRVIRPLALHGNRRVDWKTPIRLARDWRRALRPLPTPGPEWRAQRVERFDGWVAPALPEPGRPSAVVSRRSPELLNYWLDCPAAAMEGYRVHGPAGQSAYFLVSKRDGECRICDAGVSSADAAAWNAAIALAVRTAAADRAVRVVKMATSAALMGRALTSLGFHIERREPVFYWDSSKKGWPAGELSMTFAENDFFYLR